MHSTDIVGSSLIALLTVLPATLPAQPPPPAAEPPATSAAEAPPAATEVDLSPSIVEKLSAEQIVQILDSREKTRRAAVQGDDSESPAVEIVVPVALFLMIVGVVFVALYFRYRRDRHLHDTLRAMIDKGVQIPVELFAPQRPKHLDLRRGLVLVSAGLGLCIFLALLPDVPPGVWACGLIPLLMGLGYLAAWRLQRGDQLKQTPGGPG